MHRRAPTLFVLSVGCMAALACMAAAACASFTSDPAAVPADALAEGEGGGGDGDGDGDATSSPDAATPDASPDGACKGGTDGRPVVRAAGVCMDVTEVTVGAYNAFVMADASPTPDAGRCKDNAIAARNCGGPNGTNDPRDCVNWCDAFAYCEWAGKRLCGATDGGALRGPDINNPAFDAWFRACAGEDGGRAYPYGVAYDGGTCQTSSGVATDVGTHPQCRTPEGVLDLSGNLAEWIDSCTGDEPASDCFVHGGSFTDSDRARCDLKEKVARLNSNQTVIGFRCCSD